MFPTDIRFARLRRAAVLTILASTAIAAASPPAHAESAPKDVALALSVMNGRCFQSAGIPSDAIPMGDGLTAVPAGAHVDLVVAFGYTPASGAVFTMPTHGVSADLATNMAWYLQVDKIDLGVLQEGEYPYQLAIAGGTGSSGLGCTGTIAAV